MLTTNFSPTPIPLNTTTGLSFSIANPAGNAVSLTGVGFTDTLPAGLTVPNASASICGGTVTLSGGNTITLSGATIAVSSSCPFTITVTGAAAGTFTNTTGAVTSTNGGTGNTSSSSLNVDAPPTFTTSFNPNPIALNATTALQFIITNPATNPDTLAGVGFTDTLPAGLTVPNASASICGGGTVTLTNPTSIVLVGASIAPGQTCNFSVTVTGAALGNFTNTTGNVTSTTGGNGNTSSANLAVIAAPTIAKAFGAATVPLNGSTTLVFSVQNPNAGAALSGLAFVDSLPAGLVVATTPGLTNTCGGTATATAGSGTVSLSSGTLAASSSCTIQVNVTGSTAGVKNNSVQVSFTGGGANTGNASITVVAPPVITKSFTPPSIPVSGVTTLNFSTTNPNSTVGLTGVGFTDTLPAGLTVPNASGGVCGGTVTLSGGNTINLTGANIAAGSNCNFGVTVTGTVVGVYTNTTGNVTSTNGGTGNTASAGLNVNAPPTFTTSFNPNPIALNGTTALQFIITNPATNPDTLTGVGFTDTLPAGLTVPNAGATLCGGGTVTLTSPTSITLVGASIAPGQTCNFSVTVTGTALGNFTNTTGNVTSTNGGNGNTSSANLAVISAPTIAKAFGAATIPLNGSTTLVFLVQNPNAGTALTGLAFVDSLPAGLVVATTPGLANTCGGNATATAGSGTIGLALGTLAASSSCTMQVNVTGTSAGVKNNSVQVSFAGGGANTGNASITVVAPPVIIKSFGAVSIPLNGTTSLQFQVQNNNAGTPVSGIGFTDTLPAGLVIATPNGLAGSCGGGTITATAGSGTLSLSGASIAASSSCTFSVNVTGVVAGIQNNTTGNVTSTEGGTGGTASASVKVQAPPSISVSFSPTSISVGTTTALTFTVTNPTVNADPLTGVAFTNVLPSGLTVPNASATVCGGTVTLSAGNTISLTGATVSTGSPCIFAVTVTGVTAGQYTNTTGAVSSTNGGTGNTASANVAVTVPTTTTVVPSPASPTYGQPETITATITSGGGTPTGSATFTDTTTSTTLASSVPLNGSGVAAFTTSTLVAGNHTIQVSYSPTGNFAASTGSVSITVNKAVLTVTANNATKAYGAAVPTFTSTITGFVNGDTQASAVTGSPSLTTTATAASPVASYPIAAAVGTLASANYSFSFVNGTLSVTPASLSVTSNVTKVYGAPVTLTPTFTGFVNGDTQATATTGSPSLTTTATAASVPGTYPITVAAGTLAAANYTLTFANGTLTVTKAGTNTTLVQNSTVLTATVTVASPGAGIPTGTVQFLSGTTVMATVTLGTSGTATTQAFVGSITAAYSGDSNFSGSTSTVVTVSPPPNAGISLSSNNNPSTLGQPVTFTAAVSTSGGPTSNPSPTGTVQFLDGTKLLGTGTVSGGQATFTTSSLGGGDHTIVAQYSGDATWPAASITYGQTVNAVVSMGVTAAPSSPVYGQTVTLTATVTAPSVPAGFGAPTGQVTFALPGSTPVSPATTLGTATLASGTATLTLNNLSVGTLTITASYSGDSTWSPRTASVTLTVGPAQTTTSVSLSLVSGQPVLAATVAPAASGGGTPSGSVQFVDIATPATVATANLTGGTASVTVAANLASQVLARPIAAVYSGDANFSTSTSAALPAVINAAANLSAAFAPDEIGSIFGLTGLNGDTAATLPLTASLAGVSVNITDSAGTARPALLYGVFASAGQVNFVVPSGTATGLALMTLTLPSGATVTTVIDVAGSAGGIITANQTGQGPYAGQVVYAHGDGSQTVASSVVLNTGTKTYVPAPVNLGTPGDQVFLVLYGTGVRHAGSVTATVGGVSVPVLYFGAQASYPGLDQVNLGPLPQSLSGVGTVNLIVSVDGQPANTVTVAIL